MLLSPHYFAENGTSIASGILVEDVYHHIAYQVVVSKGVVGHLEFPYDI